MSEQQQQEDTPEERDYPPHNSNYEMHWLRCTPKVYQRFLNDPRFDRDKRRFESLPNTILSHSLTTELRIDVNGDLEFAHLFVETPEDKSIVPKQPARPEQSTTPGLSATPEQPVSQGALELPEQLAKREQERKRTWADLFKSGVETNPGAGKGKPKPRDWKFQS